MRYDVIVVGAGPAGSTTARECADRGLSVLLLDRSEFPRDKPCGGGVTVRAAGLLPFDLSPVVERVISSVRFSEHRSRSFDRSSAKNITYLTQRRMLDTFLAERAVQAGASFNQRESVRDVSRHPTHVVVQTSKASYEGTALVAADGANGPTAKLAGVDVNMSKELAMEGNITPQGAFPDEWADTMGFDFGGIPGGYGWLFPKGDHLNIGVGGWRHIGPTLRERFLSMVRAYGFDPEDLWGIRGFHLPLRQPGSPLVDGNVALVGDAAGLLDPLTGEGIYAAIWSGRACAQQLASGLNGQSPDLNGYQRRVEEGLLPELRVSRQFHDVFHLWPGLFVGIDRRTSILWRLCCRILRGEQTYDGVMRSHSRIATIIDFASDLVRTTPLLRRIAGLKDPIPPQRFFRKGARRQPLPL